MTGGARFAIFKGFDLNVFSVQLWSYSFADGESKSILDRFKDFNKVIFEQGFEVDAGVVKAGASMEYNIDMSHIVQSASAQLGNMKLEMVYDAIKDETQTTMGVSMPLDFYVKAAAIVRLDVDFGMKVVRCPITIRRHL